MKNFKRVVALALLLSLATGPVTAVADELDDKIQEQSENIKAQDQKIDSIEKDQSAADAELAAIQSNIDKIEQEVQNVLNEKAKEEKKHTELLHEIQSLEKTIAKRDKQLNTQAREVQTSQNTGSMIDILMNCSSINEAMEKAIAMTTMVQASNDIMTAQQEDKKQVEKLAKKSEELIAVIVKKSQELQAKQNELAEARLDQEIRIQELAASLATEKKAKSDFEKAHAKAVKDKEVQLQKIKEQQAREAAARAEAERIAKEQAAAAQAQSTNQASNNNVVNTPTNNNTSSTPAPAGNGFAAPLGSMVITSPFGWRANPTGAGSEHHDGVDFAGSSGTPIFASKGGTVVAAEYHWSAGNHVIIKSSDGYYTYYMHLSSFAVSNGQQVTQGAQVGGMGTTGNSTGVHLHFGVSTNLWSGFVNPAPLLGL